MSKDAVLLFVSPGSNGTSLTAATAVGDTDVIVDDTSSIGEDGATIVLDGVTYEVNSITIVDDSGAGVLHLASALVSAVDADEPVTILTAVGEESTEWTATVDLGDPDALPFTAIIPDKLRRSYRVGDEQAGALIQLTDDLTMVDSVPGQFAREESLTIPEGQISGYVTIGGGVTRPGQGPRVGEVWDDPALYSETASDPTFGIWRGLYDNGDTWASTITLYGGALSLVSKATGEETAYNLQFPANFNPLGGITRVADRWYVLGSDFNRSSNWYVYIYEAAGVWTKLGEFPVTLTGTTPSQPSICASGTGVRVTYWTIATGNVKRIVSTAYSTAGVAGASLNINATAKQEIVGSYYGSADFGANRLVVLCKKVAYVFDTATSAQDGNATFYPSNLDSEHRGLAWDGTVFHTLGSSARIWHHQPIPYPRDRYLQWTKYDPDLGNGPHESLPSPVTSYTQRARVAFKVYVPVVNEGVAPDAAVAARIYESGHLQDEWEIGQTSRLYGTTTTTGVGPPVVEGFIGVGGAGAIGSAAEDVMGPISVLEGAGPGMVGPYGWGADRGPSVSNVTNGLTAGTGWSIVSQRIDAWGLDTYLTVTVERTGAPITPNTVGDIPNEPVASIAAAWVPWRDSPGASMGTGRVASWQIDDNATVLLCAVAGGGVDIATGAQLSCGARYIRKVPTS